VGGQRLPAGPRRRARGHRVPGPQVRHAAGVPRIAGSFGIGLIAALYAAQSRAHGPVFALHLTGVVLAAIAAAGAVAALALPAIRDTALSRG